MRQSHRQVGGDVGDGGPQGSGQVELAAVEDVHGVAVRVVAEPVFVVLR